MLYCYTTNPGKREHLDPANMFNFTTFCSYVPVGSQDPVIQWLSFVDSTSFFLCIHLCIHSDTAIKFITIGIRLADCSRVKSSEVNYNHDRGKKIKKKSWLHRSKFFFLINSISIPESHTILIANMFRYTERQESDSSTKRLKCK